MNAAHWTSMVFWLGFYVLRIGLMGLGFPLDVGSAGFFRIQDLVGFFRTRIFWFFSGFRILGSFRFGFRVFDNWIFGRFFWISDRFRLLIQRC